MDYERLYQRRPRIRSGRVRSAPDRRAAVRLAALLVGQTRPVLAGPGHLSLHPVRRLRLRRPAVVHLGLTHGNSHKLHMELHQ